ncbi:hypothetical protein [Paenibacillus catalpae]|uniref:hypothetical protein n=1 Tax=Paenibacillus catalpae TaxID=1045775 RepID=UPI00158785D2|nr:hypothetical protein [Paenibacillus catalpae]
MRMIATASDRFGPPSIQQANRKQKEDGSAMADPSSFTFTLNPIPSAMPHYFAAAMPTV